MHLKNWIFAIEKIHCGALKVFETLCGFIFQFETTVLEAYLFNIIFSDFAVVKLR